MSEEENKQLDIKKRRFRRNAALVSFALLILMAVFYTLIGLFVNPEKAKTIAEFNSISITHAGVFMSILLGHLGFDYLDKK